MSWLDPPPVLIVSGKEGFLRRRELQKAVMGANRSGRRVEYIQAKETSQLSRIMASGSVLFKSKTLCIVHDADSVDAELVLRHQRRGSNKVSLVLHQEGDLKKKGSLARIAAEIPKGVNIHFKEIKQYKRDEYAVDFLVGEGRAAKVRLSQKMATAMVRAAGNDLGILSFEFQKVAALLSARGEKEVQAAHLRQTLSTLSQVGAFAVTDALGAMHAKSLARSMTTMRRTHVGDPTMKACALISRNITQWLHAAALLSQNAEVEEIASRLQLHPYICKTKVVPVAKNWGEKHLAKLLTSLAEIERGVRSGHINSWVELECVLIESLRRRRESVQ